MTAEVLSAVKPEMSLEERLNAIATSLWQPVQVITRDYFKLVGLPLAWITAFVLVSFLVFRKRDL